MPLFCRKLPPVRRRRLSGGGVPLAGWAPFINPWPLSSAVALRLPLPLGR